MTIRIAVFLGLSAVVGCGGSKPLPKTDRKITIEEFRKMTPQERDDPYVLENLEKPIPAKKR